MNLYLDTETYSEVPIKHGVRAYAEKAEVVLLTYALGDGPVMLWDLTTGDPMPGSLIRGAAECDVVVCHNAPFDRTVLRHAMPVLSNALSPDGSPDRWHCTMAQALAHSLPGGLEILCEILGVEQDQRKLDSGKSLISLFCKPRPANQKLRRATRETHPLEWAQFKDYARQDIEALRALYKKLPTWNYRNGEYNLWLLDQRINDRGICVDTVLASAAIESAERTQAQLADRTHGLTNGEVASTTQRDALLAHLNTEYGTVLGDMKASSVERVLERPDLPEPVRELLTVRLSASKTSASKYRKLLDATSSDGRLRGLLQFCGASRTGRWAGRTFQPQNLPRVPGYLAEEWDFVMEVVKAGAADLFYGDPMEVLAASVRGAIVAPEGRKLVVADLSNIEGRVLAWLASEVWKIKAFMDFDAGTGPDIYKLAYARSFNIKPDAVGKEQRQVGKVQELALGYQGGVGAFITFAAVYGINLDDLAEAAYATIPADVLKEAEEMWEWAVERDKTYGLEKRTFVVCDSLKRMWRRAHPNVVRMWRDTEDSVREAILNPARTYHAGRVVIRRDGGWLRIRLPSGRYLCYPSPEVSDTGQISYMGINQYSRKWQRLKTYGGKLVENITQAVARDVLAHGMVLAEEHGYEIVLSVHDELVAETPSSTAFSAAGLCRLMSTQPDWAPALPLAASGYEATRYRKE